MNDMKHKYALSVHFIYTFILSEFDIKEAEKALKNAGYQAAATPSLSEGIEPFLRVDSPKLRTDFPSVNGRVVWKDNFGNERACPIAVEPTLNVFPSGTGALAIHLRISEYSTLEDVIDVERIDRDKKTLIITDKEGKSTAYEGLYQFFEECMRFYVLFLNRRGIRCLWTDLDVSYDETKDALVTSGHPFLIGPYCQSGYPIVSIKTGSEEIDVNPLVRENVHLVSGILRAVRSEYIQDHFILRYASPAGSLSPDSRVFLGLYARACLLIYGEGEKHPGKETLESLIDTLQLLRVRMHALAVANSVLDRHLGSLWKTFVSLRDEHETEDIRLTRYIEELIRIRKDIADLLEDPIAYQRATGSFSELYDKGLDEFRIRELEAVVLHKLAQVNEISVELRELVRIRELTALDE